MNTSDSRMDAAGLPNRASGEAVSGAEPGTSELAGEQSRPYRFEVFRYDEASQGSPRFQAYELEIDADRSLLDALLKIQEEQDPSLAFRYSCRGLVCGSCGLAVNGRVTLACRTRLADLPSHDVVLEPLPGFEIVKDLVVDMQPFWDKYARIEPWLHAESASREGPQMSEAERERVDGFANCILCALCYAACPMVALREDFTGPAALAKLYRFLADSREQRGPQSLQGVNQHAGVWGCRTATRCIEVCPKNVRPFDGIAGVRRKLVAHTLASFFRGKRHED